MKLKLSSLYDNPILLRELRFRMRDKKLLIFLTVYIFSLSFVSFVIFSQANENNYMYKLYSNPFQIMSRTGETIYHSISFIQTIIVIFFIPLIIAGVITHEKEERTFDFIKVTSISPSSYIWGCLISNFLYTLLVLFCALPIIAISFLYGGVAPEDIAATFLSLLFLNLILSLLGLMFSSIFEKTQSVVNIMIIFEVIIGLCIITNFFPRINNIVFSPTNNPYMQETNSIFTTASFYGLTIPKVFFWIFLIFETALLFFIIAKRKIFNKEETGLSYTQFFVFYLIALLFIFGFIVNNIDEGKFYLLLDVFLILQIVATFIFGRAKIEVGNNLWQIKRKFRKLRTFDEIAIFLLLLLLLWIVIISIIIYSNNAKGNTQNIDFFLIKSLGYFFQIFLLLIIFRMSILNLLKYKRIIYLSIIIFICIWVLIPPVMIIIISIKRGLVYSPIIMYIINLSPIFSPFNSSGIQKVAYLNMVKIFDMINIIIFGITSFYLLIKYLIAYHKENKNLSQIYENY